MLQSKIPLKVNSKHFKISQALSVVFTRQVATGGLKDKRLFSTLAAAAGQRIRDFNSQSIANIAWAFVTAALDRVAHKEEQLLPTLAVVAEQRMRDFNSQSIANTAWVFATVGHKDEWLFTASAAAAVRCMRDFKAQELANTAWAFAMVGHKP